MGACQSRLGEASISGTNKQCSEQGYAKIKTSPTEKDPEQGYTKIFLNPSDYFSHSKTQITGACQSRLGEASISGTNKQCSEQGYAKIKTSIRSKALQKFKPFRLFSHSKTQIMGACQSRLGEASISGTNKQCSEQGYAKIKTSPTEKDQEQGYTKI